MKRFICALSLLVATNGLAQTGETSFSDYKTKIRQSGLSSEGISSEEAWAPSYDRPQYMTGYNAVVNINAMDQRGAQQGKLNFYPWTSDYWAVTNGGIAHRYAVGAAINANKYGYLHTYDYYVSVAPTYNLINSRQIDNLSPAEKYDLLMGDTNFTLTKEALGEGRYQLENGQVPGWAGICHGWALAATFTKAPMKTVTLTDATGKYRINFYPHDIRALLSQYYSRQETAFHTVGTGLDCRREDGKNIQRDPANGRILNKECNDTNPGTFHTVLVNNIKFNNKSFVLDQTFDAEIWNQPVHAYNYRYFNPTNNQPSYTAEGAMVAVQNLHNDKFRKYRSPNARYVVGVNAQVTYTIEAKPTKANTLNAQYDASASQTVNYRYDLELDAQKNIIGGEWHSKIFPDFLFSQDTTKNHLTAYDYRVTSRFPLTDRRNLFKRMNELVKNGSPYSRNVSAQYKTPLYKVIETMSAISQ